MKKKKKKSNRPLARNFKGSLTISFHQSQGLPARRTHVNFHLVAPLPGPGSPARPWREADGAQTAPLSPAGAAGSSPSPAPLPPARYFTRAWGWSGSAPGGLIRGKGMEPWWWSDGAGAEAVAACCPPPQNNINVGKKKSRFLLRQEEGTTKIAMLRANCLEVPACKTGRDYRFC